MNSLRKNKIFNKLSLSIKKNTHNCVIGIECCDFEQLFDCKEGSIDAIRIAVEGTSEKRMAKLLLVLLRYWENEVVVDSLY